MKNKTFVLLALMSVATMVACSRNEPPADNVTPGDAATAPSEPAAAEVPEQELSEDVAFSVDPGVVYACEGRDRVTSTVTWDVTRPGVNAVKVLVSDSTDPEKKTFALMAPKGEATTGEWVTQGVLIELVDAETGEELASHTVTALPCN